jgi:hypothetical protein
VPYTFFYTGSDSPILVVLQVRGFIILSHWHDHDIGVFGTYVLSSGSPVVLTYVVDSVITTSVEDGPFTPQDSL